MSGERQPELYGVKEKPVYGYPAVPLAESEVVDKALQDMDTFREKYSIDQFILDEDLEARLQKLSLQV